jgi:phage FluMu gp28-like protein
LQADAEQMRLAMDDDAIYRQEFLCEFIDEATAFLTYEQIAACTDANLVPHRDIGALATEAGELFAGVDIGRRRDLTVFWVFASTTQGGSLMTAAEQLPGGATPQLRTVALIELCNAPFTAQFKLLCELLRLPQLRRCCIDAGGLGMQLAEQAVEQFGSHRVEPIMFTNALKSHMAGALRVAVEKRRIVIPADERIRRDWHSVERTVTEAGHFRLAAPRREGSHADRFWAAALAAHAAGGATGSVEHLAARPLNFAQRGTW